MNSRACFLIWRISILFFFCTASLAQMTTVDDYLYKADGSLFSGTVHISWPRFISNGTEVRAGQIRVNVGSNGRLTVSLYPTDTATPSGVTYRVRYALRDGTEQSQIRYWNVPTSANPVTIAQIEIQQPASPNVVIAISQIAPCANGETIVSNGSSFVCQTAETNPMTSLGDMIYGASGGTSTRLAGNTSSTKMFLTQTGTGTASAAPSWGTIAVGDIPDLSGTYQRLNEKNQANGYAGLDGSSKLLQTQGVEVWNMADLSNVSTVSGAGTTGIVATITSPASGQFLGWSGTDWVNKAVDWTEVANKPSTFPPSSHAHVEADITDLLHNAVQLQGRTVASTVPSDGQALTWDANLTEWQPTTLVTGVSSVFGRTGAVVAASGDYSANQVTNTPAGNISATDVQAAINELDTEKEPSVTAGIANQFYSWDKTWRDVDWTHIANKPSTFPPSSHTHTESEITDLDHQHPTATVATLPTASSATNKIYVVTDGQDKSDCSTGGGSTRVACVSDGVAWTPASGGTGGGSGTVNTGAAACMTYYPSAGTTVDDAQYSGSTCAMAYDTTNNTLTFYDTAGTATLQMDGDDGSIQNLTNNPSETIWTDQTADPAAPAAGKTKIYSKGGEIFKRDNADSAGVQIIDMDDRTGSGSLVVSATAAGASGNCAQWDANGNLGDAGAACGSGGGGVAWNNPYVLLKDEFTRSSPAGSQYGNLHWRRATLGSPTSWSVTQSYTNENGRPGIVSVEPGTTSGAGVGLTFSDTSSDRAIADLSTASNFEYVIVLKVSSGLRVRFGTSMYGNEVWWQPSTYEAFSYDPATDTTWKYVFRPYNGTEVVVDSGVTVTAGNWYALRFRITTAGTYRFSISTNGGAWSTEKTICASGCDGTATLDNRNRSFGLRVQDTDGAAGPLLVDYFAWKWDQVARFPTW